MSFYRIYRPQVISEIDNVSVRERLFSLLSKEKKDLPHAYLFSGPKGAGKTTAARLVAKLFNCTKPTKHGPCGKCDQCVAIANGNNLDVLEIDAASNRGIDEIRVLRERIGLTPTAAAYKVYVIDEVHMLTNEAFNALLKTLEEPPLHAVFVLATTDPQKVPVTIHSRCMKISFGKASSEELLHALGRVVKEEKITIADDALDRIAETADGSFRDAVKFLEQVSFHKGKIQKEDVERLLSLATSANVATFVPMLLTDARTCMEFIRKLEKSGVDLRAFLVEMLQYLHNNLVLQILGKAEKENDFLPLIIATKAINKFTQAYVQMRTSPIASLPIDLAIIEFFESKPSMVTENRIAPAQTEKKEESPAVPSLGLLTLEKLTEHWQDVIAALKPYNHSVAGVLRSSRPKDVAGGIVTIEAFYPFHQEKLSEPKTKDILCQVFKKSFGENVKVEIVLGKK